MADRLTAAEVRALTIRQPWASLIAAGAKTIETRSWSTSYRGPVLIHAGAHRPVVGAEVGDSGWYWEWDFDHGINSNWRTHEEHDAPLGAVVAVADLTDCVPTGSVTFDPDLRSTWATGRNPEPYCFAPESQLPLGDFTPGRWAWLLDNVRPLAEPIPAKGRQGLWRPDTAILADPVQP